jgi:hypothetical protein
LKKIRNIKRKTVVVVVVVVLFIIQNFVQAYMWKEEILS